MGSKEAIKQQTANIRQKIAYQREQKKNDNAFYSRLIANASSVKDKANYRRQKAEHAASHDRIIEAYKRDIEALRY